MLAALDQHRDHRLQVQYVYYEFHGKSCDLSRDHYKFPYISLYFLTTHYDLSKSEFMIFWARIADASLGGLRREAALFVGYNLHKYNRSLTPVTNVRKASEGKIALQSTN